MEEEVIYTSLSAGALDKMDDPEVWETLGPEEKLIARALQGAEYLEWDGVPEADLEALLKWQAQIEADTVILKLLLEGKVFYAGRADDYPDSNNFNWTLSPLGRSLAGDESLPLG